MGWIGDQTEDSRELVPGEEVMEGAAVGALAREASRSTMVSTPGLAFWRFSKAEFPGEGLILFPSCCRISAKGGKRCLSEEANSLSAFLQANPSLAASLC